jgi:hypothetical protein
MNERFFYLTEGHLGRAERSRNEQYTQSFLDNTCVLSSNIYFFEMLKSRQNA